MGDRILVGVDGSDGSRQALRWALHEAQVRRGVLAPVVAWESPFDVGFGQTEMVYVPVDEAKIAAGAQQRLDDLLHQVAGPQVPVEVDAAVVHGEAAQVLCDGSADAALLVVGSRGHGSFTRLLLGSVSAKCAQHSRCPVVVVPAAAWRGFR